MQKALRYFVRKNRTFSSINMALIFILIASVPYEHPAFGFLLVPLMIVGLFGAFVMFLEDYARIEALKEA